MIIDLKTCTEEELWKFVGKHLADNGFDAVLVGVPLFLYIQKVRMNQEI